jgi:UDP-N-acetylglucosamine:LPS N-acetylglucosamine transferase
VEYHPNLVLLPHHSNFYHPDLINAADAVISKAGYSTLAEAYFAGIPFGYVSRDRFRESPKLSAFIRQNMPGFEITGETFQSGNWVDRISDLLDLKRKKTKVENGADQAAKYIVNFLH